LWKISGTATLFPRTHNRMSKRFESFEAKELAMIYQGLLCLVKSNSGVGFCNNDQGHPAYKAGIDGKIVSRLKGSR
jgi:hypothetical protein